jgi:hypothetical protein
MTLHGQDGRDCSMSSTTLVNETFKDQVSLGCAGTENACGDQRTNRKSIVKILHVLVGFLKLKMLRFLGVIPLWFHFQTCKVGNFRAKSEKPPKNLLNARWRNS